MKTYTRICLFVCMTGMSNVLMADCPDTMPVQLLEDCIVAEGSGSSFPNSTYANMELYQDWLKTQQPEQAEKPNRLAESKLK